jgi:DNA replication protein
MISTARTTDELVRIAISGAGFEMSTTARTVDELVRIALAAKQGGGTVYMIDIIARTTDELVRIGTAGRGHVVLIGKR